MKTGIISKGIKFNSLSLKINTDIFFAFDFVFFARKYWIFHKILSYYILYKLFKFCSNILL